MLSHNDETQSNVSKLVLMALFISVALVLSYIERLIPLNFVLPGVKLGLANIVTCITLYTFKPNESFSIVIIRIILSSIFVGSSLGFFYSFVGGIFSFTGMLLVLKTMNQYVSPIGVSVVGAFLHNLGQVLVLAIITSSLSVAMTYFPILILTGVVTGIIVGVAAMMTIRYLKHFRLIS